MVAGRHGRPSAALPAEARGWLAAQPDRVADPGLVPRAQAVVAQVEHRLPGSYPDRDYALAGGLMTYGPDIPDILRRSASYVHKVLKGANAGDLPIQQPTKFEFVVNLKAAQALGVSISSAVLAQATEVLQ